MPRSRRRLLNPLLWAVVGWLGAIVAGVVSHRLSGRWMIAAHLDEILVGLLFGGMRWLHGEWRVERVHHTHEVDGRVREALVVLQHGTSESSKSTAVQTILDALDKQRASHPEPQRPGKTGTPS